VRRCLLIAPLEAHATVGRLTALVATGFELHVIDLSTKPLRYKLNVYPFTKIVSYVRFNPKSDKTNSLINIIDNVIKRLRSFGLIPHSRGVLKILSKEINRIKPSVVVTFYGPAGIYFARLLKIIDDCLPIVSILNLIPSSLDYDKTFRGFIYKHFNHELQNYKNTLRNLDFVVCASSGMINYLSAQYGVPNDRTAVLPDYFPKAMSVKYPLYDIEQSPHRLIFLGAPERFGGVLDDIDDQFLEIANSGIAIHSSKISKLVVSTGLGFSYPYLTNDEVFSGSLSIFAHKFDAALITYGISKRHQRFKTTLPTRFFSALSAGIPIAVRAGLFDAVEKYVEQHSIGFIYCNMAELRSRLFNKSQMTNYRKNAIDHSKQIYAENQAKDFQNIFEFVLSDKKKP
jgi:hypothetical protein